jgi:DNA-binding CsgD family transcriptional regulator
MAFLVLNSCEIEAVRLIYADYTSSELGAMLHQSLRTIEGYRRRIMEKLGVQGKVGIVLRAIKTALVEVDYWYSICSERKSYCRCTITL